MRQLREVVVLDKEEIVATLIRLKISFRSMDCTTTNEVYAKGYYDALDFAVRCIDARIMSKLND